MDPAREPGVEAIILVDRVRPETFRRKSEEVKQQRECEFLVARNVEQMRQTGELLESDHPMYEAVADIVRRLGHSQEINLYLSLNDALEAYTVKDGKTLVFSAGLFADFEKYLQARGKHLTQDHLALIVAHELSHWDSGAQTMHLAENYCDTNGFFMADKAGYNSECLAEALEFLESIERQEDERYHDGNTVDNKTHTYPITHPSSESRRILAQTIVNDPDIHLTGRLARPTDFASQVLDGFKARGEQWTAKARVRRMIASTGDVEAQINDAQTVSQLFEAFGSSDDFHHARLVREFAKKKGFENILLAMAVYGESGGDTPFLSAEDFYFQWRERLIQEDAGGSLPQATAETKRDKRSFNTRSYVTVPAERLVLIQRILNGEFTDALSILTADSQSLAEHYPEFSGINFDKFFKGVVDNIEYFVQPQFETAGIAKIIEKRFPKRLAMIGVDDVPRLDEVVTGQTDEITVELAHNRTEIITDLKTALSAMVMRYAHYHRRYEGYSLVSEFGGFADEAVSVVEDSVSLPDYFALRSQVADRLVAMGHCQTPQAARDLASMIVGGGRHLRLPTKADLQRWEDDSEQATKFAGDIDSSVGEDLRKSILELQLSLTQGGKELGELFGFARTNYFIDGLNQYFAGIARHAIRWQSDTHLSPYDVVSGAMPTIKTPYVQASQSGYSTKKIDFIDELFPDRSVGSLKDRLPDGLIGNPAIVKKLFLEPVENRSRIGRALLWGETEAGQMVTQDISLIDSVLQEGILSGRLTRSELHWILDQTADIGLYRRYLPYLEGEALGYYFKAWYQEFAALPENEGVSKAEIVARFVEAGGVVSFRTSSFGQPEGVIDLVAHNLGGWDCVEDPEFPLADAQAAGRRIIAVVESGTHAFTDKQAQALFDVAANLIRYGRGIRYAPGNFSYPDHPVYQDYDRQAEPGFATFDAWLDELAELPASRYRDRYLSDILVRLYERTSYGLLSDDRGPLLRPELSHVRRAMKMFSPLAYRQFDLDAGNEDLSLLAPIQTLPLSFESLDVAEQFPFARQSNSPFLTYFREVVNMREEEVRRLPLQARLDDAIAFIPQPCAVRDYLIERTLLPLVRGSYETAKIDAQAQVQLLEKAHEAAFSVRTKEALAGRIVRHKLNELGPEASFDQGLQVVTQYMPDRSSTRDQFIIELLNGTVTSLAQIEGAEELLLGYSFRTDRADVRARNAGLEGVSYYIERMSTKDREELLLFLLSPQKHILRPDQLTAEFFDVRVRERMRGSLIGEHQVARRDQWRSSAMTITAEDFDREVDNWIAYLLVKNAGRDYTRVLEMERSLDNPVNEVIQRLSFVDVLRWATPESLNAHLQAELSSGQDIAATSLGPLFISASAKDRRAVIYRLCLGSNGFFESSRFESHGVGLIGQIIDRACEPVSGATSQFSAQEIQTLKDIVTTVYSQLTPVRRTEVLSRMINLIADHGGRVSRSELFKIGLTSFGVVGAKVGQMEALVPTDLREELSSLKEDVPPIPKPTVVQLMRLSGRDKAYDGIGPVLGGASTATAYELLDTEDSDKDVVGKFIRPEAEGVVVSDLASVDRAIRLLVERGSLRVSPEPILAELRTMVAEELDPSYERSNTRVIHVARRKSQAGIDTPEIIHTSARHIEMTKASGVSLKDLHRIIEAQRAGRPLTEEEQKYLTVDLQVVSKAITKDFFHGVFRLGMWHTDLHDGNIFVSPSGEVTIIDHGQVGMEDDLARREGLFRFMAGVALQDPKTVADAIVEFVPEVSAQQILRQISDGHGDMLGRITSVIAELGVKGSLNRFTKALVSAKPILDQLDNRTLLKMCIPYARSKKTLMTVARSVPSVLARRIALASSD